METFQQRFQRIWALDEMTDRLTDAVPAELIGELSDALGERAEGETLGEWVRRGGRTEHRAVGRVARLSHTATLPSDIQVGLGHDAYFGRLFCRDLGGSVELHFVARNPAEARALIGEATLRLEVTTTIDGSERLVELATLKVDTLQMTAKTSIVTPADIRSLTVATEWHLVWVI